MILEDADKYFELTLAGYQFPEMTDDEHDANWLEVRIAVRTREGSYTRTDPCYLTWEVGWLAMWLDNIVRDIPHSSEIGGLEPELAFEHLVTEADVVTLRVRATHGSRPPWTDRRGEMTLDLRIPSLQVADAAASLRDQLRRFPPRAGAETAPPFTSATLTPEFFIDWLLVIPGSTRDDAVELAVDYLRWIRLEAGVRSCVLLPGRDGDWQVRLLSNLRVPWNEPFRALFELLSHLPMPYGAPRICRPYLRPDGLFRCRGELAPRSERDEEDGFSQVRGWFELANQEDEQPFWRLLGQRPRKQWL